MKKGTVMLITFKCRAAPDVVMLENLAQYLVGIVGKRLGERGVIMHDELGDAITKLESAISSDKQERAEHDGHFHEGEDGHEHHEIPIGLAQRAFPFLDMLRAAAHARTTPRASTRPDKERRARFARALLFYAAA
jgi:hypothetical protein